VNKTETKTDADGAYVFEKLSPGEYWLFVFAKRYINQYRAVIIAPHETQPAQDFLLEYVGEGYISGVALDENEQPVEGVKIEASQTGVGTLLIGILVHKRNSSADGSFRLEGFVPNGSDGSKVPITVIAKKEGYEDAQTTVYAGDDRVLIRLRKALLGSISGRVVEAAEGDSSIPITEFQVEVLWRNSVFAFRQFQSPDGEFLFPDIDENTYDLRISAPDRAPHFQDIVTVKSGEETSAGLIRLAQGATITGKVRGKDKPEPLSGAMVYIKAGKWMGRYLRILTGASTDETGSYRLEGVPPGPNYVLASHPDYATGISPKLEVVEGREYSNIDLVLGDGGSIEGKVTDNGVPLAGQLVNIHPVEYSELLGRRTGSLGPWISIQADEKGYYHKDKLMPGFYYCSANIPSRRADVTGESTIISDEVKILEDRTTTFDIDLCEGGSVVVEGGKTTKRDIILLNE
jgi:protocatechuate 3,4-dioxygenase beta subunit